MQTTAIPMFNRRRGRLAKSFDLVAAAKGESAAHLRLWLARLMLPLALALGGGSYFAGQVRGNNISHEVAKNTHALICAHIRQPFPSGYKPEYGMPPPVTAPCPVQVQPITIVPAGGL